MQNDKEREVSRKKKINIFEQKDIRKRDSQLAVLQFAIFASVREHQNAKSQKMEYKKLKGKRR